MNSYCSWKVIAMDTLRFTMDGTRLQGHLTPKDYDMVEGNVLEVFMEQQGYRHLLSVEHPLQRIWSIRYLNINLCYVNYASLVACL